ncbi:MAG: hypothetical protein H7196_01025 [candidate division SR1 bacterium]|nr:hypothetical protein [candidate division SR1 bacterium]
MKSDLLNSQILKSTCHSLTYIVGNAVLEKYNYDVKKAISHTDLLYGGGYIHGVIEYFLKNSKYPEKEIATLCDQIKNLYCPHGLGHGFMLYNKYKVEPSLNLCKKSRLSVKTSTLLEYLWKYWIPKIQITSLS